MQGEVVTLYSESKRLVAFDILFSEDMRKKAYLFDDPELSILQIESFIFQYGQGTLMGEYHVSADCSIINIDIHQIIKHLDSSDTAIDKVFSTDSGIFCIIDFSKIREFLSNFDYDTFIDSISENNQVTENYVLTIVKKIGPTFSIISTPGLNKGFEFDGSGSFFIHNKCLMN